SLDPRHQLIHRDGRWLFCWFPAVRPSVPASSRRIGAFATPTTPEDSSSKLQSGAAVVVARALPLRQSVRCARPPSRHPTINRPTIDHRPVIHLPSGGELAIAFLRSSVD